MYNHGETLHAICWGNTACHNYGETQHTTTTGKHRMQFAKGITTRFKYTKRHHVISTGKHRMHFAGETPQAIEQGRHHRLLLRGHITCSYWGETPNAIAGPGQPMARLFPTSGLYQIFINLLHNCECNDLVMQPAPRYHRGRPADS